MCRLSCVKKEKKTQKKHQIKFNKELRFNYTTDTRLYYKTKTSILLNKFKSSIFNSEFYMVVDLWTLVNKRSSMN
jgi:hypothetical protein